MKLWLKSDLALLLRRLAVIYIALGACRIAFYLYNSEIIGPLTWGEIPSLIQGALAFDTVSMIYINGPFILMALAPLRARQRRGYCRAMYCYFMAVNAAAVCINMSDAVYFHYAMKRFTAEEAFFAGNDNSVALVAKFMVENWYLVLSVVAIVWWMARAYKPKTVPRTPIERKWAYYGVNSTILLAALYLCFGGVRGGFTRMTRPITLSNATAYTTSPEKANLILSNPFCILRTSGNQKISYAKPFGEQELERIYSPVHHPDPASVNDTIPSLAGRNVVFVILESFSAEHSALLNPGLYPDGRGFTPFLDSLMRDGCTFMDSYSNGRKSIEALPSLLSSIPSFKTPFVLMPQALAPTKPLPRILAEEGYSTAFFCGSARGSMGFGAYATSAGIEQQYGREDYQKECGGNDFDGYWGIWDEPFLQYMGSRLQRQRQPFMAAVFTLSSHHPFKVPARYFDSLPAGHTKVHRGVAYTDMAVRRFFERYGAQEWFRNTVFVFSADHVSSETFALQTKTPTGNTHIINFIYTPGGELRHMHRGVTGQIDMMPTLLGLMRYPKPYFAFGRDIFGEPDRPAVAINYMNQAYQAITDSTVTFFDERKIIEAFSRSDSLQRHPLASPGEIPAIAQTERFVRAFIQQYYSHLEKKKYLPE